MLMCFPQIRMDCNMSNGGMNYGLQCHVMECNKESIHHSDEFVGMSANIKCPVDKFFVPRLQPDFQRSSLCAHRGHQVIGNRSTNYMSNYT